MLERKPAPISAETSESHFLREAVLARCETESPAILNVVHTEPLCSSIAVLVHQQRE